MPLLFVYGTLQDPEVQRSEFGRLLGERRAELVGFTLSTVTVEDPAFIADGVPEVHAIVIETGGGEDRVAGMVLDLTDDELARADAYEPREYERVHARVATGEEVWVYAQPPPASFS